MILRWKRRKNSSISKISKKILEILNNFNQEIKKINRTDFLGREKSELSSGICDNKKHSVKTSNTEFLNLQMDIGTLDMKEPYTMDYISDKLLNLIEKCVSSFWEEIYWKMFSYFGKVGPLANSHNWQISINDHTSIGARVLERNYKSNDEDIIIAKQIWKDMIDTLKYAHQMSPK